MKNCPECNAQIEDDRSVCPTCGCPLSNSNEKETTESTHIKPNKPTKEKKYRISILAICSLLLGLMIVVYGIIIPQSTASIEANPITAKKYSTDSARFGADFYTYMYEASDTMVDELNDINHGVGAINDTITDSAQASIDALLETVHTIGQSLIIAIGCMTIALSLPRIKKDI